ncbi:MAG: hypothetical protein QM564_05135 [Bergeyella sp.]
MLSKKRNIVLCSILLIGIVLWQFGFFYRFNYLTAQMDIMRDEARILITEPPILNADPIAQIGLNEEYGFHEHYTNCNLTQPEIRGIDSYNSEIEKYLIKRNGENWRKEYQSKLEILIKDYQKLRK